MERNRWVVIVRCLVDEDTANSHPTVFYVTLRALGWRAFGLKRHTWRAENLFQSTPIGGAN